MAPWAPHASRAECARGDLSREVAIPFGVEAAATAAALYTQVRRARGRELDLAVAACALTQDAALWTLNSQDFGDIPDLELV